MAIDLNREEPAPGAPGWIVTFADLLCLLLGFFILLLSFSNMEVAKFNAMSGSLQQAFGLRSEVDNEKPPSSRSASPPPSAESRKIQPGPSERTTLVELRGKLEQSDLRNQGLVEVTDRGVALRLDGDAVFDSGSTELKGGALPLLRKLVEVAATTGGHIEVEGHSDDVPISGTRFPSNWELSAARAGSAVRYLAAQGVPPTRIKAIGYGDTRPLVPNDSAQHRAQNRRVEFLFVTEEENRTAPKPASIEEPSPPAEEGAP